MIFYFMIALVLIIVGHWLRCLRWKSMLFVYEDTKTSDLLFSMFVGYLIDLFLPFHVGDLVRGAICGKKLKNRSSFALATIIADRLLDVHIVTVIYLFFYITGSKMIFNSLIHYLILTIIVTATICCAVTFNKYIKKLVLAISAVYNMDIQLWILSFFWAFRCTFDSIMHKLSKLKLMVVTTAMWLCYLTAYLFIGIVTGADSLSVSFDNFFSFSSNFAVYSMKNTDDSKERLLFILFEFLTVALLFVFSQIVLKSSHRTKELEKHSELITPYVSDINRYDFLVIYFSEIRDKEYIREFLNINKDVTIMRNCSAGSNATTLLCLKDDNMLFRKYTLGKDSDKLYDQIKWIQENQELLSLPNILNMHYDGKICWYDMPYNSESIGFFDYIHSSTAEDSWLVLRNVLEDLQHYYQLKGLRKADITSIKRYIETKVFKNLNKIIEATNIRNLLDYEIIEINGKQCRNLPAFMDMLMSDKFWLDIFLDDDYGYIHGDLTIENIICNKSNPRGYYLIDPNSGNVHDSPNLDFAKLLQSLHGGYEFLMKTKNVIVTGNEISFLMSRSSSYDFLYEKLCDYMKRNFSDSQIKSIYYHELIHWFRLMPYKISNDSERSIIFYAGMILVMNDIFNMYREE